MLLLEENRYTLLMFIRYKVCRRKL